MKESSTTTSYPGYAPPPPGVVPDLTWTPNKWNIATQSICIALTTIFVAARLYAKVFIKNKLDWDDYASVVAWVGSISYSGLFLAQGPLGLGISLWNVPPAAAKAFIERGYITTVMYGPVAFVTKLAILLLLIRMFSPKERFVKFARGLIIALAVYYVTITLIMIYQCRPISKAWNPKLTGKCLDTKKLYITNAIASIISDLVILCSPVPVLWTLRINLLSKIGSMSVLSAGGLACIASIMRLIVVVRTLNENDRSKSGPPIVILSSSEIAMGVICGCLPVLPILFRHHFGTPQPTLYGVGTQKRTDAEKRNNITIGKPVPLQTVSSQKLSRKISHGSFQQHMQHQATEAQSMV